MRPTVMHQSRAWPRAAHANGDKLPTEFVFSQSLFGVAVGSSGRDSRPIVLILSFSSATSPRRVNRGS